MIEFLILGALALLMILIAWPVLGLYAMALSLPIIGWNFYLGNLIVPFIDLIAFSTFIAFSIRLFYSLIFAPQKKIILKWPLLFPFALFFLANILSIIGATQPSEAFYNSLRWPLFLYFAYIFLPFNIITNPKILKKTVILVTISAGLVLLSGFLSLYGQDWQYSFFRLKSIPILGVYPFGENQNLIAEFLNIGAFFILVIKEFLKDQRAKRIADIFFVLAIIGIILTFSRAGWLTLGLQLLIYAWHKTRSKGREKLSVIIITIFSLVLLSPLLWKMNILQNKNTSSTENRWLLTEISYQALKEKPLFGQGSGQFIRLVDDNIRFRAKYGEAVDAHGVLQKLIAENGLFGLATWLFILGYLLKIGLAAFKKYSAQLKWMLPFGLAIFGALFFQFFNTSYYKGKVWLPVALFLIAINFLEERYARKN